MGKGGQERKREHYYRMAKKAGYRSRASFKLEHLNFRYGIMKRGDVVVDLGAAPGGWLQIARERVGNEGFVLGVDLQQIAKLHYGNVKTDVANIADPSTTELIRQDLPRQADVVISDVSPKISGVWSVDHFRSIELVRATLSIAGQVLRPEGNMLVKVFQGELFDEFLNEVRKKFEFIKISKPPASRKGSAEAYIIAKGLRSV